MKIKHFLLPSGKIVPANSEFVYHQVAADGTLSFYMETSEEPIELEVVEVDESSKAECFKVIRTIEGKAYECFYAGGGFGIVIKEV